MLEIRDGSVQWRDAQRQVPPLAISQVQASLANTGRRHVMQLSLTPPAGWGKPIAASAEWTHGLWREPADWGKWTGNVQADVAEADVSQLRQYVDLGKSGRCAKGAANCTQAEYDEGLRNGMTFWLGLQAVDITLGKDLPPLALKGLEGAVQTPLQPGRIARQLHLQHRGAGV